MLIIAIAANTHRIHSDPSTAKHFTYINTYKYLQRIPTPILWRIHLIYFFIFSSTGGLELRALQLLGKCSTICVIPLGLFV
jgi:hypothetical protein